MQLATNEFVKYTVYWLFRKLITNAELDNFVYPALIHFTAKYHSKV